MSEEVNLANDNPNNIHMRELAGLLDFPISPNTVDVARGKRRRNLTPPPRKRVGNKTSQAQLESYCSKPSISDGGTTLPEISVTMEMLSPQASSGGKKEENEGGETTPMQSHEGPGDINYGAV